VIQDIPETGARQGQDWPKMNGPGAVHPRRDIQMLSVEAVRRDLPERLAEKAGHDGEQVRWGLENLALDQKNWTHWALARRDHCPVLGSAAHMQDRQQWKFIPTIQADEQILKPMIKAGADKYLADKN
jgi:branched-chain amino acid transport system substrate-binding protein